MIISSNQAKVKHHFNRVRKMLEVKGLVERQHPEGRHVSAFYLVNHKHREKNLQLQHRKDTLEWTEGAALLL